MTDYRDPRPASKIGKLRTALMGLLDEHAADGTLPTSVRFLFYELVMKRVISKSDERPDKDVSAALTDLRERRLVPWEDIVDETRQVFSYTGSATVAKDWLGFLDSASLDPWHGQVPFIICESRSLAGVLRGMAEEFRCRITSTNGQVGGFLHTDIVPLLSEGDNVNYLGDLDLAGGDIEANTRRVLEAEVGPLNWTRLALTRAQVDRYRLPRIVKIDRRFNDGRGRHEAVETEALSQRLIQNIVRRRLTALLPQPLEALEAREKRERDRLRQIIEDNDRPYIWRE